MTLSVLIVDDNQGFRAQARALLEDAGYEVVGEAGDGASALDAALNLRPHVVLLDIQMPDTTGFDVARALAEHPQQSTIIFISSREASDYGGLIDRSGARGFIAKADLSARSVEALLGDGS